MSSERVHQQDIKTNIYAMLYTAAILLKKNHLRIENTRKEMEKIASILSARQILTFIVQIIKSSGREKLVFIADRNL